MVPKGVDLQKPQGKELVRGMRNFVHRAKENEKSQEKTRPLPHHALEKLSNIFRSQILQLMSGYDSPKEMLEIYKAFAPLLIESAKQPSTLFGPTTLEQVADSKLEAFDSAAKSFAVEFPLLPIQVGMPKSRIEELLTFSLYDAEPTSLTGCTISDARATIVKDIDLLYATYGKTSLLSLREDKPKTIIPKSTPSIPPAPPHAQQTLSSSASSSSSSSSSISVTQRQPKSTTSSSSSNPKTVFTTPTSSTVNSNSSTIVLISGTFDNPIVQPLSLAKVEEWRAYLQRKIQEKEDKLSSKNWKGKVKATENEHNYALYNVSSGRILLAHPKATWDQEKLQKSPAFQQAIHK